MDLRETGCGFRIDQVALKTAGRSDLFCALHEFYCQIKERKKISYKRHLLCNITYRSY
jgi:hypothetical protein